MTIDQDMLVRETGITYEQTKLFVDLMKKLGYLNGKATELAKEEKKLVKKPRCCGHIVQQNGRNYATHSVYDKCPHDGHEPKPGQGRGPRKYISEASLEDMRTAMTTYKQWSQIKHRLEEAQKRQKQLVSNLELVLKDRTQWFR